MSSLWSVKDRSTSELMHRFYKNLLVRNQGRDEALRMRSSRRSREPRGTGRAALAWGAFVLPGWL